jgi:hypothetical protein
MGYRIASPNDRSNAALEIFDFLQGEPFFGDFFVSLESDCRLWVGTNHQGKDGGRAADWM